MAKFSDVLTIINGRNQKQVENPNGKYPIYGSGGVMGYADDYICDGETVVIGRKGTINKPIYVDRPFWNVDTAFGLSAKKDILLPKYLYYFCESFDFEQLNTTVTIPSLTKANLLNIEIQLPTLDEQRHIVEVLDKINELMFLRNQQTAKLDELVKVRFVEMFGDPRQNPMGWETPPLSKCLRSIDNGKSFVCKPEPRKGNWPAVLKLSAATYGVFKPEENKAVLDANEFVKEAEVHPNDLLFTRKNTPELVGMSAYVFDTAPNLMIPDLIFRLNPNESCNKIFLWQLINHDLFRAEISGLASGSAQSMSNISKERLANLKIICPPMKLQQMFTKFVEQIHRQKLTIQQSLDKLEVLKKSLMQEYFGLPQSACG